MKSLNGLGTPKKRMSSLVWLLMLLCGAMIYYLYADQPVTRTLNNKVISEDPEQTLISGGQAWTKGNYSITPLASFQIHARVLHKKEYSWGREADLSPVDFALGWGPISDHNILSQVKIDQSNRWYYFRYDHELPVTKEEIIAHSSNFHIIPANEAIEQKIASVKVDDIIHMQGYLVQIKGEGGFTWTSSLSRTDTGNGACEVFWVEDIEIE